MGKEQNFYHFITPFSLAQEWEDNKKSLLEFIWAAHWGVKGVVRDSLTGDGIGAATVHVRNISRLDKYGRMQSDITHDITSGKSTDNFSKF